jgi:8-amino-7-oxononanoate synthase
MNPSLDHLLQAELARLDAAHLRRILRPAVESGPNFASNDYLGMARHPALIEAAQRATAQHGSGAGASRLITGTSSASSGYAAALGTIPALVGRGDTVVLDKLAHASLIDAARLSGATVRIFPHNGLDRLDAQLKRISSGTGRVLIVTESLFSMDGDAAPLRELVELKERHGVWLLVDEAHATGLYGATGAGLVAEAGLSARVEIVLGTLSKALGSVGGYIAGSRVLVDWLVNRARSFIYSTALPPGVIAASHAAVKLAQSPEGTALREKLRAHIALFRDKLPTPWESRVDGAIQPLLCGESSTALDIAAALHQRGFPIPAIRYPTVPRHAARLRVTLSSAHEPAQIQFLLTALASMPASRSPRGA